MSSHAAHPPTIVVLSPARVHRALIALATALLLVAGTTVTSYAQAVNGTLLGTVVDAQGAGVPGATITITETGTNIARTAQTNASGHYTFSNLKDGTYRVSVEMA